MDERVMLDQLYGFEFKKENEITCPRLKALRSSVMKIEEGFHNFTCDSPKTEGYRTYIKRGQYSSSGGYGTRVVPGKDVLEMMTDQHRSKKMYTKQRK